MDDNEYYAAMRREKTKPLSVKKTQKKKNQNVPVYKTWQGREDAEMLIEKNLHVAEDDK